MCYPYKQFLSRSIAARLQNRRLKKKCNLGPGLFYLFSAALQALPLVYQAPLPYTIYSNILKHHARKLHLCRLRSPQGVQDVLCISIHFADILEIYHSMSLLYLALRPVATPKILHLIEVCSCSCRILSGKIMLSLS